MRRVSLLTWFLLAAGPASTGLADVVYLTGGRTLEGDAVEEGESVRIRTAAGLVTVPRTEVERIEKTKSAAEVYRERRSTLPARDADGLYQLALWCLAQGLRAEHEDLIGRVLALNPRHVGALDARRRARLQAPLPPEPDVEAGLRQEFGPGFAVKTTAHYFIVYNCTDEFADGRAGLLERLYAAFFGYFEDGQFALEPVRRRLVVVIFGSRQEFAAHTRTDSPEAATAGGYYRPDLNRSFFFAAYTEEEIRAARRQAAQVRQVLADDAKTLPRLRQDLDLARRTGRLADALRLQAALDQIQVRQAALRRFEDSLERVENARVTVVLHEATHQLVLNTGLLRNPAGDPRWLHEGLAMLFESARGGEWRGLATPNTDRLREYRLCRRAGAGPTLRALVTEQGPFLRPEARTLPCYANAWALLYYLSHRRRADLNQYLRLVAARRRGAHSDDDRLADFSAAFGSDLAALEADWRAFMDRVND
jgi:hypothetical protein